MSCKKARHRIRFIKIEEGCCIHYFESGPAFFLWACSMTVESSFQVFDSANEGLAAKADYLAVGALKFLKLITVAPEYRLTFLAAM